MTKHDDDSDFKVPNLSFGGNVKVRELPRNAPENQVSEKQFREAIFSNVTKPREGWIQTSCFGNDSEGREFVQCDMYFEKIDEAIHVREVLSEANKTTKNEVRVSREDWNYLQHQLFLAAPHLSGESKIISLIKRIEKEQGE